jgi:hypothetical protein
MDASTWQRSDLIACAALVVSLLSLAACWRMYRHKLDAERPIFTLRVEPIDGRPEWFRLVVGVTNHAAYAIDCETLQVLSPWRVKLLPWAEAEDDGVPWPRRLAAVLPVAKARRRVRMELAAAEFATEHRPTPRFYGSTDAHEEAFALRWTGGRRTKAAFRLTWRRHDERGLRTKTKLTTMLPAA